jgi:hypothetical protein
MLRWFMLLLCAVGVACGPKSMSARMKASERLANEVDEQLSKAEKAISEAEPKDAERGVADAKKTLADPDAQLYPEYEMLQSRLKEDEAKLPEVRKTRERKDLQAAIAKRKEKIDEQSERLKKAQKALEAPGVDKGAVDEASSAVDALSDALKEGAELEPKDKAYGDYAAKQRALAEKVKEPLNAARGRLEYIAGPAALRDQALQKMKDAKVAKKSDDKIALMTAARGLYDQCEDASRKLLMATPSMSRLAIMAGGQKTTPEALDTACAKEWQDVDKALAKLNKGKKKK